MKQITKYNFLIILICFSVVRGGAQDLHFSQYFNAPLLVNPANTGYMPDNDYRVGINYRNQWVNLTNPYKTMNVWADAQLLSNKLDNSWLGIGGALLSDVAGTGNLTATTLQMSVAYHQMLEEKSLLSAGIGVGWVQKRIDFSKLTFDNQWNSHFFDIQLPVGETFNTNNVNYFDVQVGVNYAYMPNTNTYLNVGISAQHLNQPNESFFTGNATIPARYNGFLNANFKVQDVWILNPNLYYSSMASSQEIVIGLNAHRKLSYDGDKQLIMGCYYRKDDAIIPMVGFQLGSTKLTFNYDATTSAVKSFNNSFGAYEVSLVYYGNYPSGHSIKCPNSVKF